MARLKSEVVLVSKPISDIIRDADINTRIIDVEMIGDYRESMREYGADNWQDMWLGRPKITESSHLYSGFHTLEAAYQEFGAEHIVEFEVNGQDRDDAYFLATGENALHGKRRTNKEKRVVVLRWLEHDDGKQYANSAIAKACCVSHEFVRKLADELATVASYERPTRRCYYGDSGDLVWIETEKIGENGSKPDAPDAIEKQKETEDGLKDHLQSYWDQHSDWSDLKNKPNDIAALALKYDCKIDDVLTVMVEIEKPRAKIDHSNARLRVQSAFFDTDMDKLDTEFPSVETGKKLDKFFALVVEKRDLRLNIFSPAIDLSVSEIREEIEDP